MKGVPSLKLIMPGYLRQLVDVYSKAITVVTGDLGQYRTTVNELTDQIPATRPEILRGAVQALLDLGSVNGANKVLSEEDKGAVLAGMFSAAVDLPLAMARIYSYDIPGTVGFPVTMEYLKGTMLVNGVDAYDELVLIDDTLSTGGTMSAMAKVAIARRATITSIRVVVEKLGFGGRERIKSELGIDVRAAIGIRIDSSGLVRVEEVMERPVSDWEGS